MREHDLPEQFLSLAHESNREMPAMGVPAGPPQLRAALAQPPELSTPLHMRLQEVSRMVSLVAPRLREAKQKVSLVIWTDGRPDRQKLFERELKALLKLPVYVAVRLCTGKEEVVRYYSDLDRQMGGSFEVLDDLRSEALEAGGCNRWLTYGAQLHMLREFGVEDELLDQLDETKLGPTQMKSLVEQLLDSAEPLPEPTDWARFSAAVLPLLLPKPLAFDMPSNSWRPWIDMARLAVDYGPNLVLSLRGLGLPKKRTLVEATAVAASPSADKAVGARAGVGAELLRLGGTVVSRRPSAVQTWNELRLPHQAEGAKIGLAVFAWRTTGSSELDTEDLRRAAMGGSCRRKLLGTVVVDVSSLAPGLQLDLVGPTGAQGCGTLVVDAVAIRGAAEQDAIDERQRVELEAEEARQRSSSSACALQ